MQQTTLSIDFGSKNIGLALVRNEGDKNIPLFGGTLSYDPVQLKKKLNPRPLLRRMRRTRKARKTRLRKLGQGLKSIGLDEKLIIQLVSYCKRRGWISLFGNNETDVYRTKDDGEILFGFSREEFFKALEKELLEKVPSEKYKNALSVCENVLNRYGDPHKEVRLIRIDNRGVSRCAWEGCDRVTPRRDNAIKDALSQFVYVIIDRDRLLKEDGLKQQLTDTLDRLEEIGKRLRNAGGRNPLKRDPQQVKAERKILLKRRNKELRLIKELSNDDTWSTNRTNIINILEKSRGRNRYCRKHSAEFLRYWIEGKAVPFNRSLTEKDIMSRREEVLFQKLWRYIEARLLPLTPNGIDRLVVERVAFDLLAGTWKQRQKIGDKALEEMYQHGPQYGFKSVLDMLKEEFGGLCAYCGIKTDSILELDHMLPKRDFIFDSYLNLVPACPTCNRQIKSKHSPRSARLTISEKAFKAYQEYLQSKFKNKAPHHLHNIKKGILKLMTDPERSWEAEQYLALIAKNYLEITGTQRSPRPLARYLSQKLCSKYGAFPKVVFNNGRHTALWRNAAYPEFDKVKDKISGSAINHAIDAIVLASKLPSPTLLEGLNLPVKSLKSWTNKVQKTAPPSGSEGIPVMPEPTFAVPGFEHILPGNYVQTHLSFLNWNRKDTRVQRQDIYGWNRYQDMPTRRTAASDLVEKFLKADKEHTEDTKLKKISREVNNIIHPHLKNVLRSEMIKDSPGEACARALTGWLRKSIKGSLPKSHFSNHPADQSRKKLLNDFIEGNIDTIPVTIGIKMLRPHDKGAVDLERVGTKNGHIIHRYRSDPAIIAKIVCYKGKDEQIDRNKPIVYDWRQSWKLVGKSSRVPETPEGLLKGRAFGQSLPKEKDWFSALDKYLGEVGFSDYAVVRQGCVAVYEDGSQLYIRNFSSTQGFKQSMLKGIVGIRSSPFVDKTVMNRVIR